MKTSTKTLAGAGGFSVAAVAAATGLLIKFEGKRNDPYWDAIGKAMTVCYGETNAPMRRYTDAECQALLKVSVEKHGDKGIAKCLPANTPLGPQIGFLSIGYNLGEKKFCASSMSRRAMAGDFKGACAAISLYQFSKGKDCRIKANRCGGLPIRRAEERAVCEIGLS